MSEMEVMEGSNDGSNDLSKLLEQYASQILYNSIETDRLTIMIVRRLFSVYLISADCLF